jgi:hypothetical protein
MLFRDGGIVCPRGTRSRLFRDARDNAKRAEPRAFGRWRCSGAGAFYGLAAV